jgi:hypothetical protein
VSSDPCSVLSFSQSSTVSCRCERAGGAGVRTHEGAQGVSSDASKRYSVPVEQSCKATSTDSVCVCVCTARTWDNDSDDRAASRQHDALSRARHHQSVDEGGVGGGPLGVSRDAHMRLTFQQIMRFRDGGSSSVRALLSGGAARAAIAAVVVKQEHAAQPPAATAVAVGESGGTATTRTARTQ